MMGDMAEFCELKAAEFEDYSLYDDGTGEMSTEEKLAMALERNAELEHENERAYGKTSITSQHLHALEESMLHELGGQVEGMATGRINYLQRIRELRTKEEEHARYRAALEEISNHRGTPTAGGYSVCDWCGVSVDAHRQDCAVAIAHRALHQEGED